MNPTWLVVLRKELKDMVRDKRAVLAIAYYAFGVPLLMAFVLFLMSDDRGEYDRLQVAIVGQEQAPGLVSFMANAGIEVQEAMVGANPEKLPSGADALVILPKTYADDLVAGKQVKIRLFVDETTKGGAKRGSVVERTIQAYGAQIATVRLVNRGVPPTLTMPFSVVTADLANSQFVVKMLGYSLVLLFMFAPFVSGMSVALDALAGERERQSLQSLMAQPVGARDVVIGKWLTVAIFSFAGSSLAMAVNLTVLNFLPHDVLPFPLKASVPGLLLAFSQMACLSLFVSGLLLTVSIHAKSFKEGQTYMSLFMMLPVLVGYSKMYGDAKIPAAANYLPIFADVESLSRILFVGEPSAEFILAAMVSSLIGAALCIGITTRRLTSEQLLADA
ncbi:MAG: ABC transporter permease [Alphaproteobacteria bacterium]|nr:MAG: ABC transporter permease [Alphaproteobacteria bacterium]